MVFAVHPLASVTLISIVFVPAIKVNIESEVTTPLITKS